LSERNVNRFVNFISHSGRQNYSC